MPAPWVCRPGPVGEDLEAVGPALTAAFAEIRGALEAERQVVIVVEAADLLGQGSPLDAAVATGLLGMMRTFAIEGAKPGWRVNMIAAAGGEEEVEATIALLAAAPCSGQLLQLGGANLGKVVP